MLVVEQETGSGNLSQKSDEDDFVKLEDLPLKLALPKVFCSGCLEIVNEIIFFQDIKPMFLYSIRRQN